MTHTIDHKTKSWIRNVSDERAAAAGCRFDADRGQFVVDWIETYCRLYEGDSAGEPLILLDWARDVVMRLFGWVRYSEKWKREIRRFRSASIWVAKKNGKSPLLSALGLYLLCGDGEPGQKVYFGAKNGTQAREIIGRHVLEMLRRSEDLEASIGVNLVKMQFTHHPTSSVMLPLSSSDVRSKQAKEGANGSILIDETHVVDRDFMTIISRAGISRSEPLQIEVSTAGNNPDGYGHGRFRYAQEVESGERTDQELFVAIYAAPQTLTEDELAQDPLKYGRMANPAMGTLVDPEEFMNDYAKSSASIGEIINFMMYRLNVWQRSANPWLRKEDWVRCERAFTEEDLHGETCSAGLDLSRTKDMCSLVLTFQGGEAEEFFQLYWFWLPERRVREIELHPEAPSLREWERTGHLIVTPGDVIDYGSIKHTFRELASVYTISGLHYDPTFAEEVTQSLEQGETDPQGRQIIEGTGVERIVFAQRSDDFATATEDFERAILAGKLHHNGHPVMSWQVGHVEVRTFGGRKRIEKPKRGSFKFVDGVAAGIMSLWGAKAMQAYAGGCEAW